MNYKDCPNCGMRRIPAEIAMCGECEFAEQREFVRGLVVGVAEMLRQTHDQKAARSVLRTAKITRAMAKEAGTTDFDLDAIDWRA